MIHFLKNIEQYILSNTNWMHLSILFFTSTALVNGVADPNWSDYFYYLLILSILFLPAILFSTFRKYITEKLNQRIVFLLWGAWFVLYPAAISLLNVYRFFSEGNMNFTQWVIPLIGGTMLLIELFIYSNELLLKKIPALNWVKEFSLEKAILFLMALFSVGVFFIDRLVPEEDTGIAEVDNIFSFVSFSFQFFIILLVYYSFYWVNHYFLISKLFKQKGFIYYGFGFVATLFFLFPIAAEIISWLPIVHEHKMHPSAHEHPFSGIHLIIPLVGMLISTPVILFAQWFLQNSEIANLEKEKSATELNLLKQQINPHFFFNTLNNLYALSLTKDEKTPEVVLQLSELMRYVIKKGKEDLVSLKEEVKYIEDYIWLQNIRLHTKLDFIFEKNIDDPTLQIPPLLFINLIENAFRHGIEPAEGDCFLDVNLTAEKNKIKFICSNSFEEINSENNGTGIKNLRRRLELRFPNSHVFKTKKRKNTFVATLNLDL